MDRIKSWYANQKVFYFALVQINRRDNDIVIEVLFIDKVSRCLTGCLAREIVKRCIVVTIHKGTRIVLLIEGWGKGFVKEAKDWRTSIVLRELVKIVRCPSRQKDEKQHDCRNFFHFNL